VTRRKSRWRKQRCVPEHVEHGQVPDLPDPPRPT
jgi:hypothetical protein